MENTSDRNVTPQTTIGGLRKMYGPHFAAGYEDQDSLGRLLAMAGANSLEEYMQRKRRSAA